MHAILEGQLHMPVAMPRPALPLPSSFYVACPRTQSFSGFEAFHLQETPPRARVPSAHAAQAHCCILDARVATSSRRSNTEPIVTFAEH